MFRTESELRYVFESVPEYVLCLNQCSDQVDSVCAQSDLLFKELCLNQFLSMYWKPSVLSTYWFQLLWWIVFILIVHQCSSVFINPFKLFASPPICIRIIKNASLKPSSWIFLGPWNPPCKGNSTPTFFKYRILGWRRRRHYYLLGKF